jgi:hypothetical protein
VPGDLDSDVLAAAYAAADVVVAAARGYGPLPRLWSHAFVAAPLDVRIGVLAVGGLSYLLADDVLEGWVSESYTGGPWCRQHVLLPAVTELQRRRYPPTGDRDTWIRTGPAGPSAQRPAGAVA